MPTQQRRINTEISQLRKRLYILNYLIDNGASTYKSLKASRPNRVKLREVLGLLYREGYISIQQDPIKTPAGIVLKYHQTYEVRDYPRALQVIKEWEIELDDKLGGKADG